VAAINRIPAFTDPCNSVGADWTNGPGDFGDITASGGAFQPASVGAPCVVGRAAGVFGASQFCTVTVGNHGGGENNIAAGVRWQGGANEACYFGDVASNAGEPKYAIYEVDNAFGFTQLASTGTGSPVSAGVKITIEIDAEGNIGLFTDEGGTDTLRLSASDATLIGGTPNIVLFAGASATGAQVAEIQGGTLFADFGDYLVGIGPYTSGTGNVTPQIPTVESGASDYFPLLLAHAAGGQPINLGTANGFSELANSPSATGAGTAGVRLSAFGNSSGAGGANPVITDPGDHCGALIALVWHPGGLPVVDATAADQKASASTSFSISGVTTTVADALVLAISGRDTDSAGAAYGGVTNANLTGLAELFDAGTTQGNGGGLGIFAGIKATAGSTGATTGTVSNSINANYCIAFSAAGGGAVEIDVGLVTETDSAFSVGRIKSRAAGLNTETDSALAVTRSKARSVGLTSTSDTAFSLARLKQRAVGLTEEQDSAHSLAASTAIDVGMAEETDSAFSVGRAKSMAVGLVIATESAFAVGRRKLRAVGLAAETSAALAATAVRNVVVGLVSETASAFSIGRLKQRAVGLATEVDSAIGVTTAGATPARTTFWRRLGFGLGVRF
jgi:hypothetical protein